MMPGIVWKNRCPQFLFLKVFSYTLIFFYPNGLSITLYKVVCVLLWGMQRWWVRQTCWVWWVRCGHRASSVGKCWALEAGKGVLWASGGGEGWQGSLWQGHSLVTGFCPMVVVMGMLLSLLTSQKSLEEWAWSLLAFPSSTIEIIMDSVMACMSGGRLWFFFFLQLLRFSKQVNYVIRTGV